MATAIQHILSDSLDDLYLWYSTYCEHIHLKFYKDDGIYAVAEDGCHRSLYALVINAPQIRAKVHEYTKNDCLEDNFVFFQNLKKIYNIKRCTTRGYHSNSTVSFIYEQVIYNVDDYCEVRDGKYKLNKEKLMLLEKQLADDYRIINHWIIVELCRLNTSYKILIYVIKKMQKKYIYSDCSRVCQHLSKKWSIKL